MKHDILSSHLLIAYITALIGAFMNIFGLRLQMGVTCCVCLVCSLRFSHGVGKFCTTSFF
jgi:hypothetical protein